MYPETLETWAPNALMELKKGTKNQGTKKPVTRGPGDLKKMCKRPKCSQKEAD